MNGDEIREVTETFRYEFLQAITPLVVQIGDMAKEVKEQGKQTAVNKKAIDTVEGDIRTVNGKLWGLIVGVPTLLIAFLGLIYKIVAATPIGQ